MLMLNQYLLLSDWGYELRLFYHFHILITYTLNVAIRIGTSICFVFSIFLCCCLQRRVNLKFDKKNVILTAT